MTDSFYLIVPALWVILLIAAVFYTRQARHPDTRPLAAYLIFVTVFTAASFFIFATLTVLAQRAGATGLLADPLGAAAFLAVVFAPAFLLARWQLKKPPRRHGPI